jgi:hypothetical protein
VTLAGDLALALDPAELIRRAGMEPDAWQEDLCRSTADQIALNCSRQSGKSTVTAALGLHEALYRPPALVLLLAGVLRQSSELFEKVRRFYDALAERVDVPRIVEKSATRLLFENGSRVVCLPGHADGVRGFSGPRLVVLDEASWAGDDLFESVAPMLAVSRGRLVLLSTPMGKRGFFHRIFTATDDDWLRVKVTAYDCPRISREWLERERRKMPAHVFEREYLCVFHQELEATFRFEDIQRALDSTVEPLFEGEW